MDWETGGLTFEDALRRLLELFKPFLLSRAELLAQ
jgi:hypothetical protein